MDIVERLQNNSRRTSYRPGVDELMNEAADEIVRLRAERDAAIREVGKFAQLFGRAEAERDRLRELLANIYDNLNDMPISEEWAGKTCDRIDAALRGEETK